jgi:hypothetical protein
MILERLRRFLRGEEPPAAPDRQSPQGWSDQKPDWPKDSPGRQQFPSPWEAVDMVEKSLHSLKTITVQVGRIMGAGHDASGLGQHTLELFSIGLQVLSLDDCEIAPRKGTFGRLAHILLSGLPDVPELVKVSPYCEQLKYLAEDLQYSGDPDLEQQGRSLEAVLKAIVPGRTRKSRVI